MIVRRHCGTNPGRRLRLRTRRGWRAYIIQHFEATKLTANRSSGPVKSSINATGLLPRIFRMTDVQLTTTPRRRDWRGALAVLALVICTLGVYGRVCGHEFAGWDDQTTIHHNPRYSPPT